MVDKLLLGVPYEWAMASPFPVRQGHGIGGRPHPVVCAQRHLRNWHSILLSFRVWQRLPTGFCYGFLCHRQLESYLVGGGSHRYRQLERCQRPVLRLPGH